MRNGHDLQLSCRFYRKFLFCRLYMQPSARRSLWRSGLGLCEARWAHTYISPLPGKSNAQPALRPAEVEIRKRTRGTHDSAPF